jgi:hypothetical protein
VATKGLVDHGLIMAMIEMGGSRTATAGSWFPAHPRETVYSLAAVSPVGGDKDKERAWPRIV